VCALVARALGKKKSILPAFKICRRTKQPTLTFCVVGGSTFVLWPLFHLRDGGKWTEMTASQHGGTLRHKFLHLITLTIMLSFFQLLYFSIVIFLICYLCYLVRGRLHVSESAYESLYDSVQDLYANRIGSQFFFRYPLQGFVYTFQPKIIKINLIDSFGSKSYTKSYGDSYGKSHV
jgi:hypothetical protein